LLDCEGFVPSSDSTRLLFGFYAGEALKRENFLAGMREAL
jgi:hypothetical protein